MSDTRSHTRMQPETLDALKGSIAKWEAIVAGTAPDMGVHNCPLCQRFTVPNDTCFGCPVMARVGTSDCARTPYMKWSLINPWPEDDTGRDVLERWATTDAHRKAAQAELDFLKSLLPAEAQTDEQQVTP